MPDSSMIKDKTFVAGKEPSEVGLFFSQLINIRQITTKTEKKINIPEDFFIILFKRGYLKITKFNLIDIQNKIAQTF